MSDDWIRVVPSDPGHVPGADHARAVLTAIASTMPIATEVTVKTPDDIAFVDAGVNQGSARCRACGEELDDGWWAAAMGESYERSAFADRRVVLPCCGTVADLNELDYGDWPVAFARWWVDCLNPGVGRLSEAQVQTLATAIGQPVTVVYRHI